MIKKITQYFLQGLLLVAPVAILIYIVYSLFVTIDGLLVGKLELIMGFKIPGLGILVSFIFVTLLGYIGETALINPFKKAFHKLIEKIPILNLLYTSLNDLFKAFVGKEKEIQRTRESAFQQRKQPLEIGFCNPRNHGRNREQRVGRGLFPALL